jgi:hypothetical protein
VIIMVSIAIRASFGLFQIPIAEKFGWLRVEFSLALAFQDLAWGIGQPIFGAMAKKIGAQVGVRPRWSHMTPASAQNERPVQPARAPIFAVYALSGCATVSAFDDISEWRLQTEW